MERLCRCGQPIPLRILTGRGGRQREWCSVECRTEANKLRERARYRAHVRAGGNAPPPSFLADNVEAELDAGIWPTDIAGRRSITVEKLWMILMSDGYPGLAHRLTT